MLASRLQLHDAYAHTRISKTYYAHCYVRVNKFSRKYRIKKYFFFNFALVTKAYDSAYSHRQRGSSSASIHSASVSACVCKWRCAAYNCRWYVWCRFVPKSWRRHDNDNDVGPTAQTAVPVGKTLAVSSHKNM